MHAAGVSRTQLFQRLPEPLAGAAAESLERALERRLAGEPLPYITGHREFYGLDFLVDRRALVPRQETETLVEQAIAIATAHYRGEPLRIADVGVGSGAIAVSLATALPAATIFATDTSEGALGLAAENCWRHNVQDRMTLLRGDLLAPVPMPVDMVVANLPYIPEGAWDRLQPEIRLFEPKEALVAGPDGLLQVRRLLEQVRCSRRPPGWLLLELGQGQARLVAREALCLFPGAMARVFLDLAGLERGIVLAGLCEG